jgi:tripartite-type tricarboxylate transporter receptor subunit TctC
MLISLSAFAVEYKLIVSNAVGHLADQWARRVSEKVKEQSNINLVVVNIVGAGGAIAAVDFKKEKLAAVIATSSQLVSLPLKNSDLPYNESDFNIIAPLGLTGVVWYTYPGSDINNINDLVKVLPKIKNSAIGAAADTEQSNALLVVNQKQLNVPVANFKSANEVVTQVAGKNLTVGVSFIAQESVWNLADAKKIKLLGVTYPDSSFTYRGYTLPSINQQFDVPVIYGGAWLAITPGDTEPQRVLKDALLQALADKDIQEFSKKTWPYGNVASLYQIKKTASKYKDLMK